jgi:hypothetical protein
MRGEMDVRLNGGDRVRVSVGWVTGCNPGDTGTVVLISPISSGGVFYHVRMDGLPPTARAVICYPSEIEPVPPNA